MDPPGGLRWDGMGSSASRASSSLPSSGCPGSPTLSSLGRMELDTPKLIFWADFEMWLLVTSDLAWGQLTI